MSVASQPGTWVGRSLQRVEDEALLRGRGPLHGRPRAGAARLACGDRALAARARADHRSTPAAALELPGVRGVLTGEDVARLSKPFPAGIDSPAPHTPPRSRPRATSASRSRSSSRATATSPRTPPSWSRSTTSRSSPCSTPSAAEPIHDRSFHYGDVDDALARADLVVRDDLPLPALHLHAGRVLRRRRRLGRGGGAADRVGELPGPVHAPRRRRRRARAARRPAATAHPARLRRLVRDQVVGPSLRRPDRARVAGARRAGALDRGPARAPRRERGRDRSRDRDRGRLHRRRRAARAPLRRDRGRRRLRPRARARDALPHARLALGRLPRAERRRPEPRRADEPLPSGLNRGFGGPQLYFGLERTMAIAARRLGLDPAELARRNLVAADEMPYRTPSGALYDSRRLRRLPRRRARAGPLRRPARAGRGSARAEGRLVGRRPRLRRRAVDLEHGLHHARPDRGRARGRRCRSRATPRARSIAIDPLGGITVRLATTPQGQGHRTVCAQVVADELGCGPDDVTVLAEIDTATTPWTVASGNYSSRFSGVAVGAVRRGRAASSRAKVDAIREHVGRAGAVAAAGRRAWRTGTRRALPGGLEPGLAGDAFFAAPNLDPPDDDDRVASSAAHGFIVDVCARRGRARRRARVTRARLRHRPRRRPRCSTRCSPTGRSRAASRTASARRCSSAHLYDEDGQPAHRPFLSTTSPRPRPTCPTPRSPTARRRRRSPRSARRGSARATR